MCKTRVQKTRSALRIEGTLSSFFENKTRLKQGDSLSPILFNLALQKVMQSIHMVPSGMKIGKEQLNILAYADDIVLIRKNKIEIRQLFAEKQNIARKLGLHINLRKTKYTIVEWENSSKQNKIGQLTVKNYTFGTAENFKYLGVITNIYGRHLKSKHNYIIIIYIQQMMVTANSYIFRSLTDLHQIVHPMKRGWGAVQYTM